MRTKKWLLLAPLALACGTAQALGLGQIQVKSKPGEPLLAEIPVVSSQPDELNNLTAQLASPDTFMRVGLIAPQGLVADLRFFVVPGENGTPVIRVTSSAPVDTPSVVFLMEVNWGEGRIVREFSALVDEPLALEAAMPPPIEDAQVGPDNLIDRSGQVKAELELPTPETDQPETPATNTAERVANEDAPKEEGAVETPKPAPQPVAPAPARAARPAAGETATRVAQGQTLSGIAGQLRPEGRSLNETMIALLRANPKAFIDGNINLVKAGAILRMPSESDWSSEEVAQANAIVRDHVSRWRDMSEAVPAPVMAETSPTLAKADSAAKPAVDEKPEADAKQRGARLQIVPGAPEAGQQAQVGSGTSAEGQGNTLGGSEADKAARELEEKVSKELELEELRSREAELAEIKKKQDELLALKNSQLAEAEQQLAKRNAEQAKKKQAKPADSNPLAAVPTWGWGAGGVLALLLGLLGWRGARKRRQEREAMRANFLENNDEVETGSDTEQAGPGDSEHTEEGQGYDDSGLTGQDKDRP